MVAIDEVHSLDVIQLVAVIKQSIKTESCQAIAEARLNLKVLNKGSI